MLLDEPLVIDEQMVLDELLVIDEQMVLDEPLVIDEQMVLDEPFPTTKPPLSSQAVWVWSIRVYIHTSGASCT